MATIGFADAYLYCNGVLCYTLDHRIRILDLHHSGKHEVVISIPALLTRALPRIGDSSRGHFRILHYSDGIVSCIYTSSGLDPTAWLIAFDVKDRKILATGELESTDKIFVRHNREFLCYGTHSEIGTDGYKKWVIHGHDFRTRKWFDRKIHLHDMVGSEIGLTICFEIHKGYFYALSNQTSFEDEEIDWTSFYHCVRFPLGSNGSIKLERTEDNSMWRRQHQEGPIDDRWMSLRLDTDEATGDLKIIESRKEWQQGSSRSRRTYYITDIIFPAQSENEDFCFGSYSPFSPSISPSPLAATEFDYLTTASTDSQKPFTHDLSAFPDEPILRLLGPGDNPHHMRPPPRLPQNTHPGNEDSNQLSFTNYRLRYYHSSASAFLDLVDDPLPSVHRTQRLRLRVDSRKPCPPLVYPSSHSEKAGLLREPSPDLSTALKEMYIDQPIQYWPPDQNLLDPDKDVDALYKLLNPPTHLGNVDGTADERSLVYVTGGHDQPQAIVFVSFDPAIRLEGLKRWGGVKSGISQGVGERSHIDNSAATGSGRSRGRFEECHPDMNGYGTLNIDKKGKGRANNESPTPMPCLGASADAQEVVDASSSGVGADGEWAWQEKAMYQDIGLGFYLGLERRQKI